MKIWVAVAALLGLAAVALGAFGAHALENTLTADGRDWWSKAVQYHMFSVAGLITAAFVAAMRGPFALTSGLFHIVGAACFSGSLYAMALLHGQPDAEPAPSWLTLVTPAGGVAMMIGWALSCAGALFGNRPG